jgi:MscS family membrane protein
MDEIDSTELLGLLTHPVVLQVFAVVFATVLANYFAKKALILLDKRASNTHTVWDDALIGSIKKPAALMIWVLGISFAAEIISAETESSLSHLIEPARYVLSIAVITLFAINFIRECEKGFIHHGADITTANAISKLLRISVFITAALTVLQTLGVSIQGLLAFGGVGGIAVGFAAKDLLSNFFGGLMIYLDRPFAVGDLVRSPDRDIEGTVEHIGWRLTIIRTFQKRPLYVPNSVFANIALENPSRMTNRRIYETIGVRYDDASKVRAIVEEVRNFIANHDELDPNQTQIVNFNSFGPSSLDFFIYCFTNTTNWVEYHGVKESVLLTIHDIIEAHGAEVAFPTTTVHLQSAEPEAAR